MNQSAESIGRRTAHLQLRIVDHVEQKLLNGRCVSMLQYVEIGKNEYLEEAQQAHLRLPPHTSLGHLKRFQILNRKDENRKKL